MKSPTQKLSKSDRDTGVRDLRAAGWSAARVIGEAANAVGLNPGARDLGPRRAGGDFFALSPGRSRLRSNG